MMKIKAGGKSKICLVLTDQDPEVLQREIIQALDQGVRVFEYRWDLASDGLDQKMDESLKLIRQLIGDSLLILTYRSQDQGGKASFNPSEYERINSRAVQSGLVDIIDLEFDKVEKHKTLRDFMEELSESRNHSEDRNSEIADLKARQVLVQLSEHSQEGGWSRERILDTFSQMQAYPKHLVAMTKVAVWAGDEKDAEELIAAGLAMKEGQGDRPYTAIAMGEAGQSSRLASRLIGNTLIFARGERPSAPGQMGVAEILDNILIEEEN